jgi:CheY-like chemotaxis protein
LLILSVEDNLANARLLNAYIDRLEGATLLEANTAFHGLKLAASMRPDVILMDIHLPGMDGYEALKRIKADSRLASCKVAALTSDAHPEQVRRGLRAGFDAYLTKPLMFESLVRALDDLTWDAGRNLLPETLPKPDAD